jgi:5-methylcytosine-specific restriction endonuclease McrA
MAESPQSQKAKRGKNNVTKKCSVCEETKSISEFHKKSTGKYGVEYRCKLCSKEMHAERYRNNTERVGAAAKKWQISHPDQKKHSQAEWNKNNHEKFRIYSATWRHRHPEQYLINKRNRDARIANALGNGWSAKEEMQLKKDYFFCCAYCGKKSKLTMDHIVSIKRGGEHNISNIVPACKSCNSSKRDTPLLIWLYKRRQQNA